MSYFFIINPNAGKKTTDIERIIGAECALRRIKWEAHFTQDKGHARQLSRRALIAGFHNIIAVGGDGTIREVAEPLVGREQNLGILPCGSGNGLARNLFIPLDISQALKGIFEWRAREIDVGLADGNPFFCAAGIGLDAEVAKLFNENARRRGILPYIYFSVKTFINYKPQVISAHFADGSRLRMKPLVFSVLNGREYGGGAKIAPNAFLDDGLLNVIFVRKPNLFRSLVALPDLFNGKFLRHKDIVSEFRLKSLTIKSSERFVYHLDGEDFKSEGEIRFSVLEKMLRVKAP